MPRFRLAAAAALSAILFAAGASAQSWPDKPVRILVPAPAGSSLDVLADVPKIAFLLRCWVLILPRDNRDVSLDGLLLHRSQRHGLCRGRTDRLGAFLRHGP